MKAVGTNRDYISSFFNKKNRNTNNQRFSIDSSSLFTEKLLVLEEAVDKLGYYSCLIHVYYLYIYINGYNRNTVIEFALFFGHQCNSTVTFVAAITVTFVAAMLLIIKDSVSYKKILLICIHCLQKSVVYSRVRRETNVQILVVGNTSVIRFHTIYFGKHTQISQTMSLSYIIYSPSILTL